MSEAAVSADGATAGMLLRQAREAAGLHVATLAANLKVSARKLEALEEDRFDLLPDAVFVRGLASSVCRTLKVDPQPVLDRLPQSAQPRLVTDGEGLNEPFHAPSDGANPGLLDQVSRPVVLTVLALLLGALVLIFLPYAQRGYEAVSQAAKPEPVMPPPGAAATVPASPAPVEIVTPPAPAVPLEPASASGAAPVAAVTVPPPAPAPAATASASLRAASVPAAKPAPVQPAASTANAAPAKPAASAAPAAPGASNVRGIVAFRARGQSWVEVTDAKGVTVFRKLMESGETAGVSGTLPLSVIVGSAEATTVEVRGKPYNLAAVSKDNVARFQVK